MRRLRWQAAALAVLALVLAHPAVGAAPSVQRGKHLYGQFCLACHGANGRGIGGSGRPIGAGPLRLEQVQQGVAPSLRGVGARAADFYLRTGYMPLAHVGDQPHRTRVELSDAEIADLTAYVVSLGSGPPVPSPHPERGSLSEGQHLFTRDCAGCHQVVAEGGYVTGAVPPPLSEATAVQIAEAVRIGPYVMPRFSQRAISDRQLDSLIAYVQYARHPDDRGGLGIGHLGPVPEGVVTWFIAAAALIATCVVIGRGLGREG